MQLSTERILPTHTGSLPRPAGLPLDSSQHDAGQLAGAVRSVVQAQIDAGVDVVNDGEASKPSYATYVTERLSGFGGEAEYGAIHAAGLVLQLDCPDLAMGWNVAGIGGTPEGFLAEVTARVAAINHATRDIPPEAMRLHLCWGNYEARTPATSRWARSSARCSRPGRRDLL